MTNQIPTLPHTDAIALAMGRHLETLNDEAKLDLWQRLQIQADDVGECIDSTTRLRDHIAARVQYQFRLSLIDKAAKRVEERRFEIDRLQKEIQTLVDAQKIITTMFIPDLRQGKLTPELPREFYELVANEGMAFIPATIPAKENADQFQPTIDFLASLIIVKRHQVEISEISLAAQKEPRNFYRLTLVVRICFLFTEIFGTSIFSKRNEKNGTVSKSRKPGKICGFVCDLLTLMEEDIEPVNLVRQYIKPALKMLETGDHTKLCVL